MPLSPALEVLLRHSSALAAALPGIERAAYSDAPALIVGEAGTGRSSVARAMHASGPRASGPLVEVDLAAIPVTLFESELFGHRVGAFTGAASSTAGRVSSAERGTLLLDHVEELPLSTQPKLLRLLAERRFVPLGGDEATADVRFLATGSDDLLERVERGAFRRDLFHRLEVLAFRLPPLRDRRQDLPGLVEFFLGDLAARHDRGRIRLSDAAWRWMLEYRWPGNLRQLRNVLERDLLMAPDSAVLDPPAPRDVDRAPRPLAEVEADTIRAALAFTRGHQQQAADLLGISRKTLWEKRKRYGIP